MLALTVPTQCCYVVDERSGDLLLPARQNYIMFIRSS